MYDTPYYCGYGSPFFRPSYSYIRLLHASPDAPAVDVYANGQLIASNLTYSQFTQYMQLPAGNYNIKVFASGSLADSVIDTDITIPAGKIFTVAAIGMLKDISLLPVEDEILPKTPGMAQVRFAHLSPDAPNVDITLPDGTVVFGDVGYKQVTGYKNLKPGTYTLQARVAGTDNVVLTVPNINLMPENFYTVYAVGLVKGKPPLQVLIPLDGNSYINF